MADPLTYAQLLENSKEIDDLLQSDNLNEEEKEELDNSTEEGIIEVVEKESTKEKILLISS